MRSLVGIFVGLSLVLPVPAAAQDTPLRFFAQCSFSQGSQPSQLLYLYWEASDIGEHRTYDPANYLEGGVLQVEDLVVEDDFRQIWLRTSSTGPDRRTLVLQSSSPPTLQGPVEGLTGLLMRGEETQPFETGRCAMIQQSNADELFDKATAASEATQ